VDVGTVSPSELGREFLQAFVIGLLVLAVFSWQQLNRPSYESGEARRRARLLKLLAPKDLRAGSVFLRAYLFLRRIARSRGLTHDALARHLGCSRPTLGNVLTGRFGAGPDLFARLRDFLMTEMT